MVTENGITPTNLLLHIVANNSLSVLICGHLFKAKIDITAFYQRDGKELGGVTGRREPRDTWPEAEGKGSTSAPLFCPGHPSPGAPGESASLEKEERHFWLTELLIGNRRARSTCMGRIREETVFIRKRPSVPPSRGLGRSDRCSPRSLGQLLLPRGSCWWVKGSS